MPNYKNDIKHTWFFDLFKNFSLRERENPQKNDKNYTKWTNFAPHLPKSAHLMEKHLSGRVRDTFGMRSGCVRDSLWMRSGCVRDAFGTRSGAHLWGFLGLVLGDSVQNMGTCAFLGENCCFGMFLLLVAFQGGMLRAFLAFLACDTRDFDDIIQFHLNFCCILFECLRFWICIFEAHCLLIVFSAFALCQNPLHEIQKFWICAHGWTWMPGIRASLFGKHVSILVFPRHEPQVTTSKSFGNLYHSSSSPSHHFRSTF